MVSSQLVALKGPDADLAELLAEADENCSYRPAHAQLWTQELSQEGQ